MNDSNDILSAIGIILVFLTFLLGSIQNEISEILDERKPESGQIIKLKLYNSKLIKTLFLKSIPISLTFLIISYILIPSCTRILKTSTFDIWDFNALTTIFICVEIGLSGLTFFSSYKTIELIKKLNKN